MRIKQRQLLIMVLVFLMIFQSVSWSVTTVDTKDGTVGTEYDLREEADILVREDFETEGEYWLYLDKLTRDLLPSADLDINTDTVVRTSTWDIQNEDETVQNNSTQEIINNTQFDSAEEVDAYAEILQETQGLTADEASNQAQGSLNTISMTAQSEKSVDLRTFKTGADIKYERSLATNLNKKYSDIGFENIDYTKDLLSGEVDKKRYLVILGHNLVGINSKEYDYNYPGSATNLMGPSASDTKTFIYLHKMSGGINPENNQTIYGGQYLDIISKGSSYTTGYPKYDFLPTNLHWKTFEGTRN